MTLEKYLDYEGLQYYHQKLELDAGLAELSITEINDMLDDIFDGNTWRFTINTELIDPTKLYSGNSNDRGAIPFYLNSNYNNVTMYVDWGDGTNSTLTPSNYTDRPINASFIESGEGLDTEASQHIYDQPGIYTIRVECSNWNDVYLLNLDDDSEGQRESNAAWIWRMTLVSFDNAVPQMKGIMDYETTSAYPDVCSTSDGFHVRKISDLPSGDYTYRSY